MKVEIGRQAHIQGSKVYYILRTPLPSFSKLGSNGLKLNFSKPQPTHKDKHNLNPALARQSTMLLGADVTKNYTAHEW